MLSVPLLNMLLTRSSVWSSATWHTCVHNWDQERGGSPFHTFLRWSQSFTSEKKAKSLYHEMPETHVSDLSPLSKLHHHAVSVPFLWIQIHFFCMNPYLEDGIIQFVTCILAQCDDTPLKADLNLDATILVLPLWVPVLEFRLKSAFLFLMFLKILYECI